MSRKSRGEKFRGSRTHGRGKKAGRGYGKRGGRGNAGLHKHRFMYMLKYMPDHFGRYGFVRHGLRREDVVINVGELETLAEQMNTSKLDLGSLGYTKLLGGGSISRALEVSVEKATERAVEKIEGAGGKVVNGGSSESP